MKTANERHELLLRVLAALGIGGVEVSTLPGCRRGASQEAAHLAAIDPVAPPAAPSPAVEWLGSGDAAGGNAPGGPRCYGSCPYEVCVPAPAARPTAVAAPPYDACASRVESTIYARSMAFSEYVTRRERQRYLGACCYAWREVGGRGRPLRASDGVRLAPVVRDTAWPETIPASLPRPDDRALCVELGAHWRETAAEEHSSVATFSRLGLELMAAGAGPELVMAALQAAQDEVRHARYAYGLAAHLDGRVLGPAPLDLRGTAPRSDLALVALECLDDGCVGELVGALALRRAASLAGDAWLAQVLMLMANEEESHAMLAFQVLRLALARDGSEGTLRSRIDLAIDVWAREVAGAAEPSAPTGRALLLARYGVLRDADVAALRAGALRDVVLPALRALITTTRTRTTRRAGTSTSSRWSGSRRRRCGTARGWRSWRSSSGAGSRTPAR